MRLASALLTIAPLVIAVHPATAQTAVDSAAIRQTALDYIDGWYSGDADRMERALHTHLAKRLVYTDQMGHSRLVDLTAEELIQSTRAAVGKIPREQWRDSVTVL
ncbi:MAG TPA: nuclear transport factor 2 family protein, partial [Gemmatimonadaceae bacterium]|nr:nuclear transport factor 2 family protein [Gemmatimonadaceae bacterium]